MVERQITGNPSENRVSGAAISPDGKTVAHHDQTGLYLRSIDNGETRSVPLAQSVRDRMGDLTRFPDGKRLLAPIFREDSFMWDPDMWMISATDDTPPAFVERNALQASISPDGESIVFLGETGQSGGLFITGIDGRSRRILRTRRDNEWIFSLVWSPDSHWIAYTYTRMEAGRSKSRTVVQPVSGGTEKILISLEDLPTPSDPCGGPFIGSCLNWCPDWRLVFSTSARAGDAEAVLWYLPLRRPTADVAGKPVRLAHWTYFRPSSPTVSHDGKRLSFLKETGWQDVYLAELTPRGTLKTAPRRFTMDNRGSSSRAKAADASSTAITSSARRPDASAISSKFTGDECAIFRASQPRFAAERALAASTRMRLITCAETAKKWARSLQSTSPTFTNLDKPG